MKAKVLTVTTIFVILALALSGAVTAHIGTSQDTTGPAASTAGAPPVQVAAALSANPVMFIENAGQFADGALFQVRSGNATIWLAEDSIWVSIVERSQVEGSNVEPWNVLTSNLPTFNVSI
jgi:hypothetical protein